MDMLAMAISTECSPSLKRHPERRADMSGWVKDPEATEWLGRSSYRVEPWYDRHGILRSARLRRTFLALNDSFIGGRRTALKKFAIGHSLPKPYIQHA